MAKCQGCDRELPEDATECEGCGRDLSLPEISEERYRASLSDDTCVACGGHRPWWSRMTWSTCKGCRAQHCRRCTRAMKDYDGISETLHVSWTCRYCHHQHKKSQVNWAESMDDYFDD